MERCARVRTFRVCVRDASSTLTPGRVHPCISCARQHGFTAPLSPTSPCGIAICRGPPPHAIDRRPQPQAVLLRRRRRRRRRATQLSNAAARCSSCRCRGAPCRSAGCCAPRPEHGPIAPRAPSIGRRASTPSAGVRPARRSGRARGRSAHLFRIGGPRAVRPRERMKAPRLPAARVLQQCRPLRLLLRAHLGRHPSPLWCGGHAAAWWAALPGRIAGRRCPPAARAVPARMTVRSLNGRSEPQWLFAEPQRPIRRHSDVRTSSTAPGSQQRGHGSADSGRGGLRVGPPHMP